MKTWLYMIATVLAGTSCGQAVAAGVLQLDSTDVIFHYHGSDTLSELGRNISCLGDVNGDGFSDIAVSSFSPACTYVFYGGDPPDTVPDMILRGAYGPAQAIDVTGDGINDVLVADVVGPAFSEIGVILIYRGFGDSLESVPWDSLCPSVDNYGFGTHLCATYVDGNSFGDLLVSKPNHPGNRQLLYFRDVFASDSVPDWSYAGPAGQSNFFGTFGFVDFDGNGAVDIFSSLGSASDSGYIGIFLGPQFPSEPDLLIAPPVDLESLSVDLFGLQVANIGDFDGDGWDDLGVMYDGRGLTYRCGPAADTLYDLLLAGATMWLASAGDVNGDGGNDIATSGALAANGSVDIYLGGGECDAYPDDHLGRSDLPPLFLTGVGYRTSTAGDFNGDGIDDFMFSCRNFAYGQPNDVFVAKGGHDIVTGVLDIDPPPSQNAVLLSQNYPNPFNPVTTIEFDLPARSAVRLDIVNMLGQRVATLVDEELPAGVHRMRWDGTGYPSGVYLYRLSTGNTSLSRKAVLLK